MDIKETIILPIRQEFNAFKRYYSEQFSSEIPLLDSALTYVEGSVGKMMRPMLVLLAAKSVGEINNTSFYAAASLELLHTASLLHDDVVDESNMRRGVPSLNALYSNRIAILTGDYLFSSSLYNSALTKNNEIIEGLSQLGRTLSSGEMLQLELQKNGGFSEEMYLEVIRRKTASLFACCARFGALSVGAASDAAARFEQFGELLGICFQIKDDIFDYSNNDVGKPTGSDMREGKITLPALYVLAHSSDASVQALAAKIKVGGELSEDEISLLIESAKNEGGIEYALKTLYKYKEEACALLTDDIPVDCRNALLAYLDYVILREK
ncbi:MAG: polyprenyl synthetase family protein [Bacteroidaceae bacterium]|nr:polyprenyl synthetase family protein [Bacteroidaceae bacterium]